MHPARGVNGHFKGMGLENVTSSTALVFGIFIFFFFLFLNTTLESLVLLHDEKDVALLYLYFRTFFLLLKREGS